MPRRGVRGDVIVQSDPVKGRTRKISNERRRQQPAEINSSPWKMPLMSSNMIKQSTESENLSLKAEVDALLVELGVDPASYTDGTLVAKTPITGETVAHVREVDTAGATSTIEKAHAAFLEWRLVPAPKRGELVRLLGEELARRQGRLGRLVTLEAGKIVVRGPRRSPGDDRHLRLRGRPVAPALRPDHRHRAPRPPHDGDLASARRRRRDLGVQFPGRGVVVERRARAGLRRQPWSGSPRRRRR